MKDSIDNTGSSRFPQNTIHKIFNTKRSAKITQAPLKKDRAFIIHEIQLLNDHDQKFRDIILTVIVDTFTGLPLKARVHTLSSHHDLSSDLTKCEKPIRIHCDHNTQMGG